MISAWAFSCIIMDGISDSDNASNSVIRNYYEEFKYSYAVQKKKINIFEEEVS